MKLGLDIGAGNITAVALNNGLRIIRKAIEGKPRERTVEVLQQFEDGEYEVGVTGINGKAIAEILEILHTPNAVAVLEGIRRYHPDARSVFDIGKENSSHYSIHYEDGELVLEDFATNPLCGAGGGALIEKMARRLNMSLEEFVQAAYDAEVAANISARCAVFAESDVTHHYQRGTKADGIAAGLCQVLARNFVNGICRGKTKEPIFLLGGVGMNKAVVRFLKEGTGKEVIIPKDFLYLKAAGCAHYARQRFELRDVIEKLKNFRKDVCGLLSLKLLEGIRVSYEVIDRQNGNEVTLSVNRDYNLSGRTRVYLGLDVGSVSTKAVLLDENGRFILGLYERTSGKPLDAVTDVMKRLGNIELGGKKIKELVDVLEAGVTGSGREIAADWISVPGKRAVVKNEITAQAQGAVYFFPDADTVFEIGGQDSKYIKIQDGKVVDNEMNKVCAASTGSFLEEQAKILGISIKGDFARLALASRNPCDLSEKCAVFMASSLLSYQDSPLEDRCAGLAYAICRNYLNRVAKEVGQNVVFQGAVAFNQAVVAGFETLLEKRIQVPKYPDLTGAIGIAMIAIQSYKKNERRKVA